MPTMTDRWRGAAVALLLAVGLLIMPGNGSTAGLVRAAGCPPVTIGRLVAHGRSCYGHKVLTFRAFVSPPCDGCGGTSASAISPRWLDSVVGNYISLSSGKNGGQIAAFVPPALGRCSAFDDLSTCPFHRYRGRWVTVTAQFNAPVAQTCRYSNHPPGAGFTRKDAVAECRQELIVRSVGLIAPATDTAMVERESRNGGSTAPLWIVPLALSSLLLAFRRSSNRLN